MAIILKKDLTTFGYRQVVELEVCLNLSILLLLTIIYCKTLTMYIFNFKKFKKNLSKISFANVVAPLIWQNWATRININ
jgi:hypothetical protein